MPPLLLVEQTAAATAAAAAMPSPCFISGGPFWLFVLLGPPGAAQVQYPYGCSTPRVLLLLPLLLSTPAAAGGVVSVWQILRMELLEKRNLGKNKIESESVQHTHTPDATAPEATVRRSSSSSSSRCRGNISSTWWRRLEVAGKKMFLEEIKRGHTSGLATTGCMYVRTVPVFIPRTQRTHYNLDRP